MVVIPRQEYERLLAAAYDEDADDVAIYKARKAELAGDPEALLQAREERMQRDHSQREAYWAAQTT